MSSYSLQCAIKEIGHVQTVGTGSFQKREILVGFLSGNSKEQTCKFELTGDRTGLLDNNSPGDIVTLHFNLEGREWKDTAFNTLKVWKVWKVEASSGSPVGSSLKAPVDINSAVDDSDDLPF